MGVVIIIIIACGLIWVYCKFFHEARFVCACGRPLKVMLFGHCAGCWRYYETHGRKAELLGEGTIQGSPLFFAGLSEMINPDPVSWKWPPGCAVCGGPVEHYPRITIGHKADSSMAGMMITVSTVSLGVPHCRAHHDGVTYGDDHYAVPMANVPPMGLLFRSYNYCNNFRELNCWRRSSDEHID